MKIERHKLYEMVWARPLRDIAPELGISDRGLAKVLERENIPAPPQGYWWSPQAQTFCPERSPSACAPYHDSVLQGIEARETAAVIRERLQTIGFTGSLESVRRYVGKLMGGKARIVRSQNQHKGYERRLIGRIRTRQLNRPPLPDGESIVRINEPRSEVVLPAAKVAECSTLLESLTAELEYARDRDPQQFIAFWFAVGSDLPAWCYSQLRWEHVQDDQGWIVRGLVTQRGRKIVARIAPPASTALREMRRPSGPVLAKPHAARNRISWLLGPRWSTHVVAIRESLSA